jgi:hypothetical protein
MACAHRAFNLRSMSVPDTKTGLRHNIPTPANRGHTVRNHYMPIAMENSGRMVTPGLAMKIRTTVLPPNRSFSVRDIERPVFISGLIIGQR